jgi:glycyl-tRNA synthetase beta chain
MAELLLEFLSEEIPARLQARAAADLRRLMTERLGQAGLDFTQAESHVTPRRLVLVVDGLPDKQPDVNEERKGPKLGAPDQAIQGFLKANGLESVEDAEVRETPKGTFYFAVRHVPGRATAQVLPDLIFEVVRALPWPRSMRWGTTKDRWVRPLWSVVGVFDGASLPAALIFGEEPGSGPDADPNTIWFGKTTTGHRFLAPELIQVTSFADYRDKLRAAKVILDREERRRIISEQAAELAQAEGLSVKDDPDLLEEVIGLVEWPVVLMATIDEDFMTLPPEVLTTTMRSHQKYFALLNPDGTLAKRFVLAANMETPDGGRTIVTGNERVLRARLADARFFWDQDRKRSLASRAPELARIVFHAKLGSLDEKVDRVQALAAEIATHVPGANRDRVRSAARLAKADLTSGMVGEFPELQGIMGRYYALQDGEATEVAEAIAEHYGPLGPRDRCPSAPVSVSVALADKIDTLVGFFAIDERPTGSKDPFALRRAALGVIRLIVENGLRLPLTAIFQTARELYGGLQGPAVTEPLLDFFADRLKVALKDKGVRHDLVALGGEDDLVRLLERVKALESFLATDDGANLLVAYRRAANIVRIEQKKDKQSYDGAPVPDNFRQDEEIALHDNLAESAKASSMLLEGEDFSGAMSEMARLRGPVDAFFDEVTVNAEDPELRENRLRLLARIGATLGQVADFSRIEG